MGSSSSSLNSQNKKAMSTGDFMSADASDDSLSKETRGTIMTNQANYRIAQETNAMNKSIADANLDFQREQQAYERDLQQQMFQREDTAIQRQVADSRAAGVSPLANLSGAASSGVVANTTTPQSGYQAQAATMQNGAFGDNSEASLAKMQSIVGAISQVMQIANQTSSTINNLQSSNVQRQLDQQLFDFNSKSMTDKLDILKWQAANEYGRAYDYASRRGYEQKYGITPDMSDIEKAVRLVNGAVRGTDKMTMPNSFDFGNGRRIDNRIPSQLTPDDLRSGYKFIKDSVFSNPLDKASTDVSKVVEKVTSKAGSAIDKALDGAFSSSDKSNSDKPNSDKPSSDKSKKSFRSKLEDWLKKRRVDLPNGVRY